MAVRAASHAGSWYTDNGPKLAQQLSGWLDNAERRLPQSARAIIAPHAGYSYSGATAAHAYKHVDPAAIKRVFVLGPSHHVYLEDCALTKAAVYETPVGAIDIDRATVQALESTKLFSRMPLETDEDEHSLELHLPFIAHVMRGHQFSLVPILVGSLSPRAEQKYGALLGPYLDDPANLFVISSDFCHWGKRFRYTYVEGPGAIHESIERLDKEAMALIEKQDFDGFIEYQRRTKNTICGRHPIGVVLQMLRHCSAKFDLSFVKYAQSSACVSKSDSSVSYGAAVMVSSP